MKHNLKNLFCLFFGAFCLAVIFLSLRGGAFGSVCVAGGKESLMPPFPSPILSPRTNTAPNANPCISGTAPVGAYVMANTGEIVRVGADGKFALTLPVCGFYCLKAVADGMADAYVPRVEAPNSGIDIKMKPDASRRVVHGNAGRPSAFNITDGGSSVHWFDIAGTPYGAWRKIPGIWQTASDNFWTLGEYAFSATGNVKMVELKKPAEMKARGWYKGDCHAHIVHGENIYRSNPMFAAFIGRAEGYDWLYLSGDFSNDGAKYDIKALSKKLSDENFLLNFNYEFPKNGRLGHFANVGAGAVRAAANPDTTTQFELVEKYISSRGGIAFPVHPYSNTQIKTHGNRRYSGMTNKEVFFFLLCAPDRMPLLDIFYSENAKPAFEFYLKLLDRGYRIGVASTSDAAIDVGRSPATRRGATYVKMPKLSEAELLRGINGRRTSTTFDGHAIILSVDGMESGEILAPKGTHKLKVEYFCGVPARGFIEIYRDGKVWRTIPVSGDGENVVYETEIGQNASGYLLAVFRTDAKPSLYKASASPVYFRGGDFVAPEILPFPRPFPKDLREYIIYLNYGELTDVSTIDKIAEMIKRASK